jgi:hypothetical protein
MANTFDGENVQRDLENVLVHMTGSSLRTSSQIDPTSDGACRVFCKSFHASVRVAWGLSSAW